MFFQSRFSSFVPTGENRMNDIYLCQSGWESCKPGHSCIGLVRDHYLLHFVASGRGIWKKGDRVFELGAGDAFLICPGEVTEYYADRENPWEYCWFGFSGDKSTYFLSLSGLSGSQPLFRFDGTSIISSIVNMHNSVMKSANPVLTGAGHVMIILNEMAETTGKPACKATGRNYARIAVNYMELHYSREITVNSLAEMIAINRSHFYRIFYEETGVSPREYLIGCRIRNAKRLLKNSRLSVNEVAAAVGYQDPVNFSKIFKTRVGITLGNFRN